MEKLHGAVIMQDDADAAETRVFKEVSELGADLQQLADCVGSEARSEVAIIWDVHSTWARDCNGGLNGVAKPLDQLDQHYDPFWKNSIGVDIVDAQSDLMAYKLIVVPGVFLLRPGFVDRLESAARSGAHVIIHPLSAWVDDDLKVLEGGRLGPQLRALCGVRPEELDDLRADESVQLSEPQWVGQTAHNFCDLVHVDDDTDVLSTYQSEFYAGKAALTRKKCERGAFWYCAAGLNESGYEQLYTQICTELKIVGPFSQIPEGVQVRERQSSDRRFVFIHNISAAEQTLAIGLGWRDVLGDTDAPESITLPVHGVCVLSRLKS